MSITRFFKSAWHRMAIINCAFKGALSRRRYKNSINDIKWSLRFTKDEFVPLGWRWEEKIGELSPYFRDYGFCVPMKYCDLFSCWSGIKSDRYMSMDLYFLYVCPALNHREYMYALTDKNMFDRLFQGVKQPLTVCKNWHGVWYDGNENVIDASTAIALVQKRCHDGLIIKPTFCSACGKGVQVVDGDSSIRGIFDSYGRNFIVQERLKQHKDMARLNPTSLNTIRVYSYRDSKKNIHVLDRCTVVRIGGKGAVCDNAHSGGFFAGIDGTGTMATCLYRVKDADKYDINSTMGFSRFSVPNFKAIKGFVKHLHDRIAMFDFVGWDVAINEEGMLVLVEFNVTSAPDLFQMAHGPLPNDILDDIMSRVSRVKTHFTCGYESMFENGSRFGVGNGYY